MYNIAILDDDANASKMLQYILNTYSSKNDVAFNIKVVPFPLCTSRIQFIHIKRDGPSSMYDVKEGFILLIHHDCGSFVVNGSGYEERSKSVSPQLHDNRKGADKPHRIALQHAVYHLRGMLQGFFACSH